MTSEDIEKLYELHPKSGEVLAAFSSSAPKRARKESLSKAIGGAAVAIVKALQTDPKEKTGSSQSSDIFCLGASPGVSPGRAVDLRMKKITNN